MLPLATQLVNTPQVTSMTPAAAPPAVPMAAASLTQAGMTSGALSSLGPLLNPVALFGSTSVPNNIASTTAFTASPLAGGGGGLSQAFGGLGQMLGLMANTMMNPLANPNTPSNIPSNIPANLNTTADPVQRARLDQSLAKISQDPEGAVLLQAAINNGFTFEVGNPDVDGTGEDINGATVPNQNKIIINPNAPEFDKTLAHELVHASTENDGDSQQEEGLADVIGYHISSRVNGTPLPGSDTDIFNNKIQNYPNLVATNDIINSLLSLGITV